ncbi:hypothetical protein V2H45_22645 [Tumidithrix elongata RA019]|uniref:Uncharacterized protein n=1 Tax=Tumidithrix elongata BACA0141 TaxID=2716417 RepID=A0AAW9Q342_9CYAN|nr:hypothetical protein [Tumidithrix elongata RA019]
MATIAIFRLIDRYIGSSECFFLGDFNDQTLVEFYPKYCEFELEAELIQFMGRNIYERFAAAFFTASCTHQAKIIRGVLKRFPLNASSHCPETRTKELYTKLLGMAEMLDGLSHPEREQEGIFMSKNSVLRS